MKRWTGVLVVAAACAAPVFGQGAGEAAKVAAPVAAVPAKAHPVVQIAILLDTSNSMDGLIEQAKTQLWKIVNEAARARRDGMAPDIQVALYQYGTPSLGAETGYIKQLSPLTDDLDKISQELFALRTSGGDEYCGRVIDRAAEDLAWSTDKNAYKAIFIAGNEPFTQGNVSYADACKKAISKGVVVNTIFCGNEAEGVQGKWKDGAALADGAYAAITQETRIVQVVAPQDKEIAELGAKINTTYVPYGRTGVEGAARQSAQDANAAGAAGGRGGAAVERSITKAGPAYGNSTWDLVDAVNRSQVKLEDVKTEDLPAEMQKMTAKERADFVAGKNKEREEMKGRIQQLSAERDKYLADQRAAAPASTLDKAMLETVHSQAEKQGMGFSK